ncbi:hypothetical protein MPUCK001_13900 [Citrobacter koseri]|nr:hypothetical protein MPUCK001_13900 [Citrobacter koseri]
MLLQIITICISVVNKFHQESTVNEDGMEWFGDWAGDDVGSGDAVFDALRSGRAGGEI